MIGLIFCDVVISGELVALMAALLTAGAVSFTFVGAVGAFVGDAILTVFAIPTIIGSGIAFGPAALAIILALGGTLPFTLHIPI